MSYDVNDGPDPAQKSASPVQANGFDVPSNVDSDPNNASPDASSPGKIPPFQPANESPSNSFLPDISIVSVPSPQASPAGDPGNYEYQAQSSAAPATPTPQSVGQSSPGNDPANISPDPVAQILSNFGADPVAQPAPSYNGPTNNSPDQMAQIHSVFGANPKHAGSNYGLDYPDTTPQNTLPNQAFSTSLPSVVLVGGHSLVRAAGGAVVIGSSTLAPGSQATIQTHIISAGSTNVAVGGSSYLLPTSVGGIVQEAPEQQDTLVLVGGQPLVKAADGAVVVDGSTTVAPGAQATAQGHIISTDSSNIIVDGSSSYVLPTSEGGQAAPLPSPVLVDGQSMVGATDGAVIIGGSAIVTPSAQATVQGHLISVGSSNVVVDGSSNYAFPTSAGGVVQITPLINPTSPIMIAGQPMVKAADGGLVIGRNMLTPSARITDQGHVISVGPSKVVVDSSSYALPTSAGEVVRGASLQRGDAPLLVDGQPLVEAANGEVVVGSTTLNPGAQVTIGGHTVSEGASNVLVDGTSYALPTSAGGMVQDKGSSTDGSEGSTHLTPSQTVSRADIEAVMTAAQTGTRAVEKVDASATSARQKSTAPSSAVRLVGWPWIVLAVGMIIIGPGLR